MGGAVEGNRLAREIHFQGILAQPVDVGHALYQIHLRHSLAGIAESELADLDGRVGRQANRAATTVNPPGQGP